MTIQLASKPGITGASTLAIPKTWDPNWFRDFVNNQLKGADVRNAVGVNGISITGNISTPYATIGFTAPVTLPAPVIISGPATLTAALTVTATSGASNIPAVQINGDNVAGARGLQVFGGTTGSSDVAFLVNDAPNTQNLFQIQNLPKISAQGPVAAALVDMTPDAFTFTGVLTGFASGINVSCRWIRSGNFVTVVLNDNAAADTGTSNSTSMSMTGLPAAIQPVRTQYQYVPFLEDNSVTTFGTVAVNAGSGTLTFFKGNSGSGASFTNGGTKGLNNPITFSYTLT